MKNVSLASVSKLNSKLNSVAGVFLLALFGASNVLAANVVKFSPQGEVAQIRQVRATFSESAVAFGDPKAGAPFDIKCSEAGSSRWADDKNWIFDFNRDLPPGTQCSFTLKPGFKTVGGNLLTGKACSSSMLPPSYGCTRSTAGPPVEN